MHDLEVLIESGRKLIVIETEREGCYIEGFRRIANRSNKAYFQWTVTQGLLRLSDGYEHQVLNKDTNQLFAQIQDSQKYGVYILVDFHHYLDDPTAIRHIKDVLINSPKQTLILLSQKIELPDELANKATHFKLPLPTIDSLRKMVNDLAMEWMEEQGKKLEVVSKGLLEQLLKGLCGLSHGDAERMARHAIWNDGIIDQSDIVEVAERKFGLLNSNNVLNLELDFEELDNIAGFDKLKEWLQLRRRVFAGEVQLPGGDKPKGMLLLGVQGCGKSMAAKAVAGSWQLPLLHLDFGTLEKGMSAVSSSDDVSKRLLGTFLTWLAEKKSAVFVVATANDVSKLPPELMRKGRFDEVFFVDLPNQQERAEILKIHLQRRDQQIDLIDVDAIAAISNNFSGAELEQLVVSALYHTYSHQTTINTELMKDLVGATQPLAVLMAEKISALQDWAKGRAVSVS